MEQRIHTQWSDAIGPELGRRARPGRLDRGVLEVRVDNSPWLAELTLRQADLLAALAARFPGVVRGLRLGLGRRTPDARPATAPATPAEVARPALPAEELAEIDAMVSAVRDPEVAHALRRLMQKDRLARRRAEPSAKGVS